MSAQVWSIPAKTFLLGEYAALRGNAAIVVTTEPSFELTLCKGIGMQGIHPDSPAGKFWQAHAIDSFGLSFYDPYDGVGGLGASSAQFVGVYQALAAIEQRIFHLQDMLETYWQYAWQGKGVKPSGYDVVAQATGGLVYVEQQSKTVASYAWPFTDLDFILIHTGQKLATHEYLQVADQTEDFLPLAQLVARAYQALLSVDSDTFVRSIIAYYETLLAKGLVASHSIALINQFKQQPGVLAAKGCGAMGADVVLLLVDSNHSERLQQHIITNGYRLLSTSSQMNLHMLPKKNYKKA